ncbi:hypothetical protein LXA43DRAFT_1064021 [Ganoderma leucocontextum]|nr:hypothetical protein LXA43DRAFT_1064021 [Ganoderma leucocontextum]
MPTISVSLVDWLNIPVRIDNNKCRHVADCTVGLNVKFPPMLAGPRPVRSSAASPRAPSGSATQQPQLLHGLAQHPRLLHQEELPELIRVTYDETSGTALWTCDSNKARQPTAPSSSAREALPISPDNGIILKDASRMFERSLTGAPVSARHAVLMWLIERWPRIADGLFSICAADEDENMNMATSVYPFAPAIPTQTTPRNSDGFALDFKRPANSNSRTAIV